MSIGPPKNFAHVLLRILQRLPHGQQNKILLSDFQKSPWYPIFSGSPTGTSLQKTGFLLALQLLLRVNALHPFLSPFQTHHPSSKALLSSTSLRRPQHSSANVNNPSLIYAFHLASDAHINSQRWTCLKSSSSATLSWFRWGNYRPKKVTHRRSHRQCAAG